MLRPLCIGILLLSLYGCSEEGPATSLLEDQLQTQLPKPWMIESFNIAAKESIGSKTEPAYKYRLIVEAAPNENLYERTAQLTDVAVIKKLRKRGDEIEFHVVSQSHFKNGQWLSLFNYDVNPFRGEGNVATRWGAKHVEYASSDYEKLVDQHKAQYTDNRKKATTLKDQLLALDSNYSDNESHYKEKHKVLKAEAKEKRAIASKQVRALSAQINNDFRAYKKRVWPKYSAVIDEAKLIRDEKNNIVQDEYNQEKSIIDKEWANTLSIQQNESRQLTLKYQQRAPQKSKSLSEAEYKDYLVSSQKELHDESIKIREKYDVTFDQLRNKIKEISAIRKSKSAENSKIFKSVNDEQRQKYKADYEAFNKGQKIDQEEKVAGYRAPQLAAEAALKQFQTGHNEKRAELRSQIQSTQTQIYNLDSVASRIKNELAKLR